MTIAERIWRGESAAQTGISEEEYTSRKETLARFLENWAGVDFDSDYRRWLAEDTAGHRGTTTVQPSQNQPTRAGKITIVRPSRPCRACGGGKVR